MPHGFQDRSHTAAAGDLIPWVPAAPSPTVSKSWPRLRSRTPAMPTFACGRVKSRWCGVILC